MKINLPPGQESELPSMIIECCSQERTYSKYYGLIGERLAKLNRLWTELFEASFTKYYDTIHRYETNRLRNIACFFSHMLSADATGWHVLSVIHLNEDETTSSSRIFIKILFQGLAESLGMSQLQNRLKDDLLRSSFDGLFPIDDPRNTRFSVNYFTSIGMGGLTEEMREHLKSIPRPAAIKAPVASASESESESSVSSYSSYTRSSISDGSRSRSRSRTVRRRRSPSYSSSRSSPSPPRSRGIRRRSYSRSFSPSSRRRARRRSYTSSLSPPPRTHRFQRNVSTSRSRSPSVQRFRAQRRRSAESYTRSRSLSRPRGTRNRPGRPYSRSPSRDRRQGNR